MWIHFFNYKKTVPEEEKRQQFIRQVIFQACLLVISSHNPGLTCFWVLPSSQGKTFYVTHGRKMSVTAEGYSCLNGEMFRVSKSTLLVTLPMGQDHYWLNPVPNSNTTNFCHAGNYSTTIINLYGNTKINASPDFKGTL